MVIKLLLLMIMLYMSKLTCKECKYRIDNTCSWFKYNENKEPKEIPDNIYNKGCNYYCDHPLLLEMLRIFK